MGAKSNGMKGAGKIKNILVATDFSRNANVAARFAAEIAQLEKARLIIFHAFYPFFIWDESLSTPAEKFSEENPPEAGANKAKPGNTEQEEGKPDPEAEAQKKLDTLAQELHREFGISVTRLIKPGFAADEIPDLVDNLKVQLVVIGARGTDYQEDKLFGEVSSDLLATPAFPLLCIPPAFEGNTAERIAHLLQQKRAYGNPSGLQLLRELSAEWNLRPVSVKKAI